MKKLIFLLWIVITITLYSIAPIQAQSPGGVKNSLIWVEEFKSQNIKNNKVFNYHTYSKFDNIQERVFNSKVKELNKLSLFLVFFSQKEEEVGSMHTSAGEVIV